jgi:hypothetical protein
MIDFVIERDIARSPGEVFAYVVDATNNANAPGAGKAEAWPGRSRRCHACGNGAALSLARSASSASAVASVARPATSSFR